MIHKGMKVQVAIDGGTATSLAGTVSEILPAADPSSHGFLVKIDLPSSSPIRAGMYGTAEFANGTKQAILIPRSAVVVRGRSPACMFSTARHSLTFVTSPWARHREALSKYCREYPRGKVR